MANEVMDKVTKFEVNGEEVKLTPNMIKQFLVSGNGDITDQETAMFLNLCKYQHLNPFLNEAYLIKFGSKPAQIVTSKEAFMKRAESHPQFDGIQAGCIVQRNNDIEYTKGAFVLNTDVILGAWADVFRKDRKQPHHVEINMKEFNKGQATWKDMPANMIRKTVIVNALREAFPESLGAMYTEDDKQPNEATTQPSEVEATETDNSAVNALLDEVKNEAKGDGTDEPKSEGQSETTETSQQSIVEEVTAETNQQELL